VAVDTTGEENKERERIIGWGYLGIGRSIWERSGRAETTGPGQGGMTRNRGGGQENGRVMTEKGRNLGIK